MISSSTGILISLKSTPMVATVFRGNFPAQILNARQVFPTFESPV